VSNRASVEDTTKVKGQRLEVKGWRWGVRS